MQGITLKNGLISYYGNPAGYTEKDTAVVDSCFQNDELTAWLKSRSLMPHWTDGVLERLAAGEQLGASAENARPLKNVRIWQLKPDTNVYKKFISLDETKKQFGAPDSADYRIAYDGQLGTNDLEVIFERCNINHPPGYNGHSLSISDVVELYDSTGSEYHYCDHFGFKQIEFEPQSQAEEMTQTMTQSF
ncbi:MAG: YodL domain-containing protein [Oscillospiraceae bacterium]|nr:YodL domain-containing protein [Oscillospiraceae bacterium]